MSTKQKLTTKDIVLIGLMVATIEAAKIPLSMIPGVELVSLLILLYSLVFGRKIYYALVVFVALEGILFGFGIWWVMYLYTWPLLAFLTHLLKKNQSILLWSAFLGAFGLFFGALCSIPYYFTGGPGAAITWWIAGIPTDITHGISNFIVCFVLFTPLKKVLERVNYF